MPTEFNEQFVLRELIQLMVGRNNQRKMLTGGSRKVLNCLLTASDSQPESEIINNTQNFINYHILEHCMLYFTIMFALVLFHNIDLLE